MRVGNVEVSGSSESQAVSGTYLLKLLSVEDAPPSQMFADAKPQWLLKWEIVRSLEAEPDEDQEASVGEQIWDYVGAWVGFTLQGRRSKALERIDACMGVKTEKPDDGEVGEAPIDDTNELIGRLAKAAVEVAPNTKGLMRAKIVQIGPYRAKRRTTHTAAIDDEDDEDAEPVAAGRTSKALPF